MVSYYLVIMLLEMISTRVSKVMMSYHDQIVMRNQRVMKGNQRLVTENQRVATENQRVATRNQRKMMRNQAMTAMMKRPAFL